MPAGSYSVRIEGDGLTDAEFDVLANGVDTIPITNISSTYDQIEYTFVLEDPANIELRTFNNSQGEIILNKIQLSRT